MDTEDLLTVADVAALKGVSRQGVYSAIRREQLPVVRKFGRVLVERAAADLWEPVLDMQERGKRGGSPMHKLK